jgi:hypothetical protein
MLVMVVTAVALVLVLVVVMATATILSVCMMVMLVTAGRLRGGVTGVDSGIVLDGAGDGGQLGDQRVGILCGDAQLFGGKGDGGFLDFGMGVKFAFNPGGAVGAVQIVYDVDLFCHWVASLYELTYEQSFM